ISLIADATAAGDDLGALPTSRFEITRHPLELLVGDERAELGLWIKPMAEADLAGLVGHTLHQPVEHALVRVKARAGCAALAHVEEDGTRRAIDRDVHVGVGEHDRRRFAAEFERYLLQIA